MTLASIDDAIEDIRAGKFVIIVDDEDRENEGDLVVAAQLITPEHISFMTRHGSGLVCMPVIARRLDELGIGPMVERNTSRLGTAFSVSIDAKDNVTTGASAFDRAATIRKVLDPAANSVLLRAMLLDKAVYEVLYEARNRPNWMVIPLESLAEL